MQLLLTAGAEYEAKPYAGRVLLCVAEAHPAGLHFDHAAGTGVVLHMLSGLAIDGRFGFTAIGRTVEEAAAMEAGTRAAVEALVLAPGR